MEVSKTERNPETVREETMWAFIFAAEDTAD